MMDVKESLDDLNALFMFDEWRHCTSKHKRCHYGTCLKCVVYDYNPKHCLSNSILSVLYNIVDYTFKLSSFANVYTLGHK